MSTVKKIKDGIISDTATSNRLIQLRIERKLSQEQVAEAIGVSKSTYCRMERKSDFSVEVLKKLLSFHDLTYEQFYNIQLPMERYISYSPKKIVALEAAINEYGRPPVSPAWGENRERYHKLKVALDPVLAEREEQMAIPDFNIDEGMVGRIIVTYKFDAYSEWLVDQCLSEQQKLLNAICG